MGPRDCATLEAYFASVSCMELPNKRVSTTDEAGEVHEGAALYAGQLAKLRAFLAELMAGRGAAVSARMQGAPSTPAPPSSSSSVGGGDVGGRLTASTGLWFMLLPRLVRAINSGKSVGVTRLIDDAWLESLARATSGGGRGGAPEDAHAVYRAFLTILRPSLALSAGAALFTEDVLQRFSTFHALACDVAVRVTAARLRGAEVQLLTPSRIRAFARPFLEHVLDELEGLAPCRAMYGATKANGEVLGVPVERPGEPVCCLQEARSHDPRTHRGSRRVLGGGSSLWARLFNVCPYTPVWPGAFTAGGGDARAAGDIDDLLDDVEALVGRGATDFLGGHLRELQVTYASARLTLEFAPLGAAACAVASMGPEAANITPDSSSSSSSSIKLLAVPLDPVKSPFCVGCAAHVRVAATAGAAPPSSGLSSGVAAGASVDSSLSALSSAAAATAGPATASEATSEVAEGRASWVSSLLRGVVSSLLVSSVPAGTRGGSSSNSSSNGSDPLRRIRFEESATSPGGGSASSPSPGGPALAGNSRSSSSGGSGVGGSPIGRLGGMRKSPLHTKLVGAGGGAGGAPATPGAEGEQQRVVLGLCAGCCGALAASRALAAIC